MDISLNNSVKNPAETLEVLLIDDSEDDYTICAYRLQKVSGGTFSFTWAESASQARSLLNNNSYDCIICDYQMPGEDGLSFLRWLREKDEVTPLVFFTGQGNEQIAAQALKNGANDYFTKNQEFAQFERLVNSIVSATESSRRNLSLKKVESAITRIDNETIYLTGVDYLGKLVSLLCEELGVNTCFVASLDQERDIVETCALVLDGQVSENVAFKLSNSPCQEVMNRAYNMVSDNLKSIYPDNEMIGKLDGRSYVGVSLFDSSANAIGILSLMDTKPLEHTGIIRSLLTSLSARAGVELERSRSVEQLQKNREFLKTILQDQTDAIVRFRMNGDRTFANRRYCDLYKVNEESIIGSNVYNDITRESMISLRARIKKLTPEDPVVRTLRKMQFPDGTSRYIEWTDRALFDENGEKTEIQSVGRDVSERIAVQEKHSELEARFQGLLDAAGDAIFTMNAGKFMDANKKALEMFELTKEEMIGSSPDRLSPEFQPDGESSSKKAQFYMEAALEKPVSFNWIHRTGKGKNFDAQVTLSRLDINGEIRILAIVRDLSELKKIL